MGTSQQPTPLPPKNTPQFFSEVTTAPTWMRAIGVLILAVGVVVAVVVLSGELHHQVGAIVSASMSAALGIALGFFGIRNKITLAVNPKQVTLGFRPIWKKVIPRDEINELAAADLDPVQFGGLGLRRVPNRTWALLFTGGPGLVVSRKSDGAAFYIRTNRADEAIAAFRGALTE